MRKNIITMNLLVAFFSLSQFSYVPNLPQYAQSLGADAFVLGVIGGVVGVAQILLRIPLGLIYDKFGKDRRLMTIGAIVLTASSGILILANNTGLIILGRLIAGASGAWWALQSAMYGNYHQDEIQVKAQGMLGASANWGKVLASLVGGLIAQYLGVHAIFIFSFFIAIFCIFLAAGLKDIPRTAKQKPAKSFWELLPIFLKRDMVLFSSLTAISVLLFVAGPTYFTVVAAQGLGSSSMDFGLLNMVFYLFSGLISLCVGSKVFKKIGNIHSIAVAFLITGSSCIPYFYHINIPIIYLMQAFSGIGTGISCAILSGLVLVAFPREERGAINGIYQSLVASGALIGPVLVGSLMKTISFDASYWSLVILAVAAALMSYLLIPSKYNKI